MRIAILTFHRAANCGAVLQAWALKTVLERMGHSVEFPKVNNVGNEEGIIYHLKRVPYWRHGLSRWAVIVKRFGLDLLRFGRVPAAAKAYRRFRAEFLPERDCEITDLPRYYDLAVVGSDQVWNPVMLDNDEPLFLGESIPAGLKLVAYAASCGDHELQDEKLLRLTKQLPRFAAISVREEFARDQLRRHWDGPIEVVADPTLLLSHDEFAPLVRPVFRPRPYLYVYTIHASDELLKLARDVARRLDLELIVNLSATVNPKEARPDPIYEMAATPDKMVSYIAGAAGVIAASFHGTALALVFNKPLVSVVDFTWRKIGRRQRALLESVGLEDRLITEAASAEDVAEKLRQPLPPSSAENLESIRTRSLSWLTSAVKEGCVSMGTTWKIHSRKSLIKKLA